MPKLAVGIREAAEMLSCSPRTIQNYIRSKTLPRRKIGRRTVIPISALQSFLRTDHPSPNAENLLQADGTAPEERRGR